MCSHRKIQAEFDKLYPRDKEDYLRRFTAGLDDAIRAGHIPGDDQEEILAIAEINFGVMP
ncbi:hypothetical protein KRR38_03335 [Novosphingobium sp. G106]|uniref:hypothetical protein n=1 Tax=Novosphingobium sp. G106 TaxID=2849500 RepID=UPI001C2D7E54|nr:hypothetical protein [Novosphingobium sp. G106]MBV1686729.1 hypothetical protein [Novosphingobium sp. G106]